jgi:signal transduction histidine kinase
VPGHEQIVVVPHRKKMIMSDPRWLPLREIMDQPDWDSFAAVPLVVDGRLVGVLNVFYAPAANPPGREALAFLTAMAEQAALAVDRAALVSAAEIAARQEERHRVASELHDSVVQQVFSIKMRAEALRLRTAAATPVLSQKALREQAEELVASARGALDDLRRLIFELRPAGPADLGLIGAIRDWAASLSARTGLDVAVASDLEFIGLPSAVEDDIYRIVQEALHNVVKHAEATSVAVEIAVLGSNSGQFVIDIVDDGVGFRHQPQSGASLGMVSMRERAARWGGTVVLRSRGPGGGHVRLTIPLTHQGDQ